MSMKRRIGSVLLLQGFSVFQGQVRSRMDFSISRSPCTGAAIPQSAGHGLHGPVVVVLLRACLADRSLSLCRG